MTNYNLKRKTIKASRLLLILITFGIIWEISINADTVGKDTRFVRIPKILVAYVEAERYETPDDSLFTHYIYSFAEFNDSNDGLVVRYPERLHKLSALKNQNSELKIILGIGGAKKEGFSEMARSYKKRISFAKCCKKLLSDYNLDGVDLDWEFPTTEKGGHTACDEDDVNYGLVVKQLRETLGKNKWISFYSNNTAKWIDFDKMLPYVDYVNVSGYNLDIPKPDKPLKHQSPLYTSEIWGSWCISESIKSHLNKGVPREKILLGIPFFGRGKKPFPGYLDSYRYENYIGDCKLIWDDEAKVPYYADSVGNLVLGFDNEESIRYKCDFIHDNGIAGAFVWNYDADFLDHRLAKALNNALMREEEKQGEK